MWLTIKSGWGAKIIVSLFGLLSLFWIYLQIIIPTETEVHTFFGAIYGLVALLGALWGIKVSLRWGFLSSIMGRAIAMLALGLLAQEFGQLTLSFYHYVYNLEGLYPSLGDVGFFGSIPCYIYGTVLLAQASGVRLKYLSAVKLLQAIIIPLLMLGVGYYLFLQGYEFEWSQPIKVFLDFGYPFGQAIYVSMAIITYLLSRGVLGGIMKGKILLILFGLIVQFLSDYTFLYQTSRGTWHVGELNDFMYLASYFIMAMALIQLETVYKNLMHE